MPSLSAIIVGKSEFVSACHSSQPNEQASLKVPAAGIVIVVAVDELDFAVPLADDKVAVAGQADDAVVVLEALALAVVVVLLRGAGLVADVVEAEGEARVDVDEAAVVELPALVGVAVVVLELPGDDGAAGLGRHVGDVEDAAAGAVADGEFSLGERHGDVFLFLLDRGCLGLLGDGLTRCKSLENEKRGTVDRDKSHAAGGRLSRFLYTSARIHIIYASPCIQPPARHGKCRSEGYMPVCCAARMQVFAHMTC